MSDDELFELEKRALLGDIKATLELVSMLRAVRAATRKLLTAKYSEGERYPDAFSPFELEIQFLISPE